LDQFDVPDMTVAALTRRCRRIASLRGDAIALSWLTLESTDVANISENKSDATRESLAARLLKQIPAMRRTRNGQRSTTVTSAGVGRNQERRRRTVAAFSRSKI